MVQHKYPVGLRVRSSYGGNRDATGTILTANQHNSKGAPCYLVRWDDGRFSVNIFVERLLTPLLSPEEIAAKSLKSAHDYYTQLTAIE